MLVPIKKKKNCVRQACDSTFLILTHARPTGATLRLDPQHFFFDKRWAHLITNCHLQLRAGDGPPEKVARPSTNPEASGMSGALSQILVHKSRLCSIPRSQRRSGDTETSNFHSPKSPESCLTFRRDIADVEWIPQPPLASTRDERPWSTKSEHN